MSGWPLYAFQWVLSELRPVGNSELIARAINAMQISRGDFVAVIRLIRPYFHLGETFPQKDDP